MSNESKDPIVVPPSRSQGLEREAIAAFLREFGMMERAEAEDLPRLMAGAAHLLRDSMKTLMELLSLRTEQNNRYRHGVALRQRQDANPLVSAGNEVDAIRLLLASPDPAAGNQALAQTVEDLVAHVAAIESAYQELIREVIDFVAGDEEDPESARRGWMDRRAQKRALQKRLATLRDEDIMRREFFEHRFAKLYQDALAGGEKGGEAS